MATDWSQYCGSSPTPAPTGTCQGSCGACAYDDYDYGSSGGCCCKYIHLNVLYLPLCSYVGPE